MTSSNSPNGLNRRNFIAATGAAAIASSSLQASEVGPVIAGKADHVISIWLGGGMGQIDTFDPKAMGDPKKKKPGSYYKSIPTCVDGVELCEHLPRMANLMDRTTAIRTVNHSVIDEHATATNWMHVGRPASNTIVYPSIGSIIAHERGAATNEVPAYVLIGYPNATRGPGFLGAKYGYLYLTETGRGPAGLTPPVGVNKDRMDRRKRFLTNLRKLQPETQESKLRDYDASIEMSMKLSGQQFMSSFKLDNEHPDVRESYGGEFGQRCLLARRLIERGVRFIEVSHNLNFLNGAGWDVHNAGIEHQHELIKELDVAMSGLMIDLEKKGLLEKTLITITSEFGRPPGFDSGGGRGHQSSTFSCVLAGGGLQHMGAYGQTDELSKKVVKDSVSVSDLFATIHAAVGVNYKKSLYDGDRPVPITDNGVPVKAFFA